MDNVKQLRVPKVTIRPEVVYHIEVAGEDLSEVFREVDQMAGMKQLRAKGGMSLVVDCEEDGPLADLFVKLGLKSDGFEAVVIKASQDFFERVKENAEEHLSKVETAVRESQEELPEKPEPPAGRRIREDSDEPEQVRRGRRVRRDNTEGDGDDGRRTEDGGDDGTE